MKNQTLFNETDYATIYFGGINGNNSYALSGNNSANNFSNYSLSTTPPIATDGSLMWSMDMFNFEINGRIMKMMDNTVIVDPFE